MHNKTHKQSFTIRNKNFFSNQIDEYVHNIHSTHGMTQEQQKIESLLEQISTKISFLLTEVEIEKNRKNKTK